MTDGEDEDPNMRYWKTKYELLYEDYGRTKERSEQLENRLLDCVEQNEKRESENEERIRQLESELEEAKKRIEQLEAACFRYKNRRKPTSSGFNDHGDLPEEEEVPDEKNMKEIAEIAQKIVVFRTTSADSVDGITRSPEFHAGHHEICEYHKLPILARGEGFIYGFRWTEQNKIHIV